MCFWYYLFQLLLRYKDSELCSTRSCVVVTTAVVKALLMLTSAC